MEPNPTLTVFFLVCTWQEFGYYLRVFFSQYICSFREWGGVVIRGHLVYGEVYISGVVSLVPGNVDELTIARHLFVLSIR